MSSVWSERDDPRTGGSEVMSAAVTVVMMAMTLVTYVGYPGSRPASPRSEMVSVDCGSGTILFTRRGPTRGVYVVRSDGTCVRRLTHNQAPARFSRRGTYQAAWAPSGRFIAFVSGRKDGRNVVMLMRADGSRRRRLTDGSGVWGEYGPSWSPTSRSIAYADSGADRTSVHRIRIDGTGSRRLVRRPSFDPAWSPDGTRIGFVGLADRNRNEIFVMDADGSGEIQLTASSGGQRYEPDNEDFEWSPDGSKFVYVSEEDGNREIYVMNNDGTDAERLTESVHDDFDPAWSPDGTQVVFVSNRDGYREIYTIRTDGTEEARITHTGSGASDPVWSPDGSLIAFVRATDKDRDIYVVAPDGSGLLEVTSGTGWDLDPEWHPSS